MSAPSLDRPRVAAAPPAAAEAQPGPYGELLAAAAEIGERARAVAAEREAGDRELFAEVAAIKESGILAAAVPARLGGPAAEDGGDIAPSRRAELLRVLAYGNGSLAQILQPHFVFARWLFEEKPEGAASTAAASDSRRSARETVWAERILGGALLSNAQAERGPHVAVIPEKGGNAARLDGEKHFCTGSPYADFFAVSAFHHGASDSAVPDVVAFVDALAPGLSLVDEWDALGQRLTGSGRVRLDGVRVAGGDVHPFEFGALPAYGAFAQLLHAAIDVGLAEAALDEALDIARSAGIGGELTEHLTGELAARAFAAAAVLDSAGRAVDLAFAEGADPGGRAALAVGAAKATTGELTVDIASRVFELTGTRGVAPNAELDRRWRDLRTHTLHEKRRDKLRTLGRAFLTGNPPELGTQF
ncbi:acyl-CoA dehydrogenase family protein [Dietzia sp.]|uniref:acyl-CoA dehydrogenase family protein n=1 Tax=Dietzia sp. TaxID=1871616 RepID=UPI002FDACDD8